VETYLNAETLPKMMRVLEEEGLEKRQSELLCKENSGCAWLLKNEKMDDLARMYRMFARLPEGLAPMVPPPQLPANPPCTIAHIYL